MKIENISKKFWIDYKKNQTALQSIISFFSGKKPKKEFYALKDITFNIENKEKLGIIGLNGSGKSTLLLVIAGIYSQNSGEIISNKNIKYLPNFNQGIKPDLTMRENIFLVGSVMGLGQKDIKKIFNKIVEDADLLNYLDTKISQFSSGMKARFSFSLGINCLKHINPDILLMDEIFAGGGDIRFVNKATEIMEKFIQDKTVIMVSHSLNMIQKYCKRTMWLDKGKIVKIGKTDEVIKEYVATNLKDNQVKRYLKKKKNQ